VNVRLYAALTKEKVRYPSVASSLRRAVLPEQFNAAVAFASTRQKSFHKNPFKLQHFASTQTFMLVSVVTDSELALRYIRPVSGKLFSSQTAQNFPAQLQSHFFTKLAHSVGLCSHRLSVYTVTLRSAEFGSVRRAKGVQQDE
jgi:hypothetical protein